MPASQTGERVRQARDLVLGLDRARVLHHFFAFENLDALGADEIEPERIEPVECDAAILRAAVVAHDRRHGRRECLGLFQLPGARRHVVPADERPALADRLDAIRQVLAAAELEQDRLALRRNEAIPRGNVRRPHRHVARAGRVADVGRIAEESRRRNRAS
jgi:hypothetical protein